MALLQCGVDIAVIALWLGHESIETTNLYVHANLAMKEKALAKVARSAPGSGDSGQAIDCWRSWNRSE
jgi:site-specific recombinase XerD